MKIQTLALVLLASASFAACTANLGVRSTIVQQVVIPNSKLPIIFACTGTNKWDATL